MDFRFVAIAHDILRKIGVRTVHNRSLISTNKIDPSKKATHRLLSRQWSFHAAAGRMLQTEHPPS